MWAVVDGAGLQCGGSLMQRAERLFLTKTKALSELPPSVFAGAKGKRKRSAAAAPAVATVMSELAHEYLDTEGALRFKVRVLADMVRASVAAVAYTGARPSARKVAHSPTV